MLYMPTQCFAIIFLKGKEFDLTGHLNYMNGTDSRNEKMYDK